MKHSNNPNIETVIAGSTDPVMIKKAVENYKNGLIDFLTINSYLQKYLDISKDDIKLLERSTQEHVAYTSEYVEEIILELNQRYQDLRSEQYEELKKKDRELWNSSSLTVPEGVMLCVDQGVVTAIYPPDSIMGRSLAGNTRKQYIPSLHQFVMDPTFMKKVVIHEQRQNIPDARIEWIVVHTGCGRVGQMLSNTHNPTNFIPNFDPYFNHIDALVPEFAGAESDIRAKLENLRLYWQNHRPGSGTSSISDEGRLAAVLQKVAKRQALRREISQVPTEMPIQLVDKRNLNIFTGLDNISVITDARVLKAGGFTDQILETLTKEDKIFSLKANSVQIYELLEKNGIQKGTRTYKQLQTEWISVQEDLLKVTQILWKIYESATAEAEILKQVANKFIISLGKSNHLPVSKDIHTIVQRRLIHDMFHVLAYTYVLNTFEKGNDPGEHMETHLETGNPDEGALLHLALGQGEIAIVNALNLLTEYAVLGHSKPGKTGAAVPALLRLDTDRPSSERMSFEETIYAQNVLHESLKLWPYMFGDIVPFVVVRGKQEGGISRLPLSVLKIFDNLGICFERGHLPLFAPAATSKNEVVLVPSRDIVHIRLNVLKKGGGLMEYRNNLSKLADGYASKSVQRAFQREYKQDDKF